MKAKRQELEKMTTMTPNATLLPIDEKIDAETSNMNKTIHRTQPLPLGIFDE